MFCLFFCFVSPQNSVEQLIISNFFLAKPFHVLLIVYSCLRSFVFIQLRTIATNFVNHILCRRQQFPSIFLVLFWFLLRPGSLKYHFVLPATRIYSATRLTHYNKFCKCRRRQDAFYPIENERKQSLSHVYLWGTCEYGSSVYISALSNQLRQCLSQFHFVYFITIFFF